MAKNYNQNNETNSTTKNSNERNNSTQNTSKNMDNKQIVGSEPGKPQRKQPLRFFRVFRKPAARSAYINICRNEVIV